MFLYFKDHSPYSILSPCHTTLVSIHTKYSFKLQKTNWFLWKPKCNVTRVTLPPANDLGQGTRLHLFVIMFTVMCVCVFTGGLLPGGGGSAGGVSAPEGGCLVETPQQIFFCISFCIFSFFFTTHTHTMVNERAVRILLECILVITTMATKLG